MGGLPDWQTYELTLRNSKCNIPLWHCRSAIDHIPAALNMKCLSLNSNWISVIRRRPSAEGEERGNGATWSQRRKRRVRWWNSLPTADLSRGNHPSSTWSRSCWSHIFTGRRWFVTCSEIVINRQGCHGCLDGRGRPHRWPGFDYYWRSSDILMKQTQQSLSNPYGCLYLT